MRTKQQDRARNINTTFGIKCWPVQAMTVSRSASHIASTLSASQRNNALAEALAEVTKDYGDKAIDAFLDALKGWFNQRDYRVAAELVDYFQTHGCLPEIEQPASPRRRISRGTSKANGGGTGSVHAA
ncbi:MULTISPECIES: hypothetical protein [unclassified Caballeronia]|uniref:hypothetical protein n=1 Tax=unclassified Caballeronia TaxID=2646786 RepID=UPI0013EC7D56|nr:MULTISPECIES: hypothetical protein [unclassified Caballeronia]